MGASVVIVMGDLQAVISGRDGEMILPQPVDFRLFQLELRRQNL